MDTLLVVKINQAIAEPRLSKNIRGQIKAACFLLDASTRLSLALDYAEHVAWIIEENRINIRSSVLNTIDLLRQQLEGKVTVDEVRASRIEAFYSPQFRESLNQAQSQALLAAYFAIYNGDTYKTAESASHAIALHYAGLDWEAKDKLRKQM